MRIRINKYTYTILFILSIALTAVKGEVEKPGNELSGKVEPPSRIELHTDASGSNMREVTYWKSGSKKHESIEYEDGRTASVDYSESGVLKRIEERYPARSGKPASIKRLTVFDEKGYVASDQILRPDGTIVGVSTGYEKENRRLYKTVILDRAGEKPSEISLLFQADDQWRLSELRKFRVQGTLASRTVRNEDGTYLRSFFAEQTGRLSRQEHWNAKMGQVRTLVYRPDGVTVAYQTDESRWVTVITRFNKQGKVIDDRSLQGDLEVATIYDSGGRALFRQIWTYEDGKRRIKRVEEIKGTGNKQFSFFFYDDGKTVNYLVEKTRKGKNGVEVNTYELDRDGRLVFVDSSEGNSEALMKSSSDIGRRIFLKQEYLIYKSFERPTSALADKPVARKLDDAVQGGGYEKGSGQDND